MMEMEEVGRSHSPSLGFIHLPSPHKSLPKKCSILRGMSKFREKKVLFTLCCPEFGHSPRKKCYAPYALRSLVIRTFIAHQKKFSTVFDQLPVTANFQSSFANQSRCTASVAVPYWSDRPSHFVLILATHIDVCLLRWMSMQETYFKD